MLFADREEFCSRSFGEQPFGAASREASAVERQRPSVGGNEAVEQLLGTRISRGCGLGGDDRHRSAGNGDRDEAAHVRPSSMLALAVPSGNARTAAQAVSMLVCVVWFDRASKW